MLSCITSKHNVVIMIHLQLKRLLLIKPFEQGKVLPGYFKPGLDVQLEKEQFSPTFPLTDYV